MTNRLLTPEEAARIITADINEMLMELPEEERKEAAWHMCNALSRMVGGPGLVPLKKKKNERKQDNSGVRKESKGMGKHKGRGDGRSYEPRGFPALKANR